MGDSVKKDNEIAASAGAAAKSALVLIASLTLLSACGEDAADPGTNPPPPPPPPAAPAPPPAPPPTFAIGGTVSGLTGTGLVLQNNSGDDLAVSSNGNFTFVGRLASGAAYNVTTRTQPSTPTQVCVIASGAGTVAAANVTNVAVTCAAPPAPTAFTIGGTVTGLKGSLVLQNNGGDDLTLNADGPFAFAGMLANGASYNVSVRTQPASPPQVCTVSNGSGAVPGANVGNVGISCVTFLTVTSTTPADNAAGVARNATITVQFSANVDPTTINESNITLTSAGGNKRLTFATNARDVVITPAGSFFPAAHYTLTITPAVRGAQGEVLAGEVVRSFRATDGQWSAPRIISAAPYNAAPRIAFDASGNAIAIWRQSVGAEFKVAATRYVAGTGWGTPVIVDPSSHNVGAAELAVDPSGNAFAVWSDYVGPADYRVLASRYTPASAWSPEVQLSGSAFSNYPQVAVDPAGNAIAVWEESDGAGIRFAWAKRYVIGSGWGGETSLGGGSGTTAADLMAPQIAMDRDGNAIATYRVRANLIYHDGIARRFSPATGWEAGESFEAEMASVSIVPVVFAPNGDAFAFWTQGSANFGHASIWANRYDANDGWKAATLLESDDIAPGSSVSLAVDAAGNAIAVWQHSDLSRARTDIWANRYVAGVGWGTETRIENQRLDNANGARVAMDASGNAIAVWRESDNTRYSLWTNRYVVGSGWNATAMLLETDNGEVFDKEVAVDSDGNAFAIWTQFDGANTNVWVSRFE